MLSVYGLVDVVLNMLLSCSNDTVYSARNALTNLLGGLYVTVSGLTLSHLAYCVLKLTSCGPISPPPVKSLLS